MSQATRPRTHQHGGLYSRPWIATNEPETSISALADACGEIVYFIRCADGLIKVGYSNGNLSQRKRAASSNIDWKAILAVKPGTRQTERYYLDMFRAHLAKGQEWFYPHQEILDVVNEIRGSMGLSLLASF